jgi:WD40 repeat protein
VELWDAATGEPIRAVEGRGSLRLVAIAKAGSLVLGTGWGLLSENIEKGRLESDLIGASIMALSADGNRILTRALDAATALSLRDLRAGKTGRMVGHDRLDHRLKLASLAVSPKGTRLLAGGLAWPGSLTRSTKSGDPAIALWDLATGELVHSRRLPDYEEIAKLAFSAEGAVAFSHDSLRKLTRWNIATGKGLTIDLGGDNVYPSAQMDTSADGTRAVTLSDYSKRVVLWDVAAAKAIRTFDVNASVKTVAISPDGARIAAASEERKVRVWDAAKGDLLHTFEVAPAKDPQRYHPVTALAFSADGAVLAACQGADDGHKRVMLWNVASGRLLRTFDFRCAGSLAVSQDAGRVLAGDNITIGMPEGDLTLRLGDTAGGQLMHSFNGTSAALARDGRRVFTASHDGAIRIWDAEGGGLVATLLCAPPHDMRWSARRDERQWLAVTPEGFLAASSEAFATAMLAIVRGLEVQAIDASSYRVLHRPDLVAAKLAGDPDGAVKAAAAELEGRLARK